MSTNRLTKFAQLATILSLSLAVTVPALADEGSTFKSADGRMSFWTPSQPKSTAESLPSQSGSPYKRTTYAVEGTNYLLLASILDFRGDLPTTGDEVSFLDSMLESIRRGFGTDFVLDKTQGSTELKLEATGWPGRELKGTVQGAVVILRAYVAPNSIYMLQATYEAGDASVARVGARFLSSFVPGEQ